MLIVICYCFSIKFSGLHSVSLNVNDCIVVQNILDSEDVSKSITKIIMGLKNYFGRDEVIRKSLQYSFELITRPENRNNWDRGFTNFLYEIGTTFPEEIKAHSLPFVVSLVDAEVRLDFKQMANGFLK